MNKKSGGESRFYFYGLVTLVFVTLKLCGVIGWSWWWVLAPIWIPYGIGALGLAMCALGSWLDRPRTPEERVAAKCREMAEALRKRQ